MEMENIKFNANGLIPVIVQESKTGQVLMLAYMNEESILKTIETKNAHYYSRSREKLWLKGETSGNFQEVDEILLDCDNDTILLKVKQKGVACHTGKKSCFNKKIGKEGIREISSDIDMTDNILVNLFKRVKDRSQKPVEGSYTNYLLNKGIDKILKKVGEESSEVIIAAKNNNNDELRLEVSDLMYHLIVLLVQQELNINEIFNELENRNKER